MDSEDLQPRSPSADREAKIIVLGQDGVGKSALVVRAMTKRFIGDYDPNSETLCTVHAPVDGKMSTLRILDTAGPDLDSSKRDEQLQWAEGVMLVFSLVDRRSFESLWKIAKHVTKLRDGKSVAMMVVGNKCDLTHLRSVSRAEATRLSNELNCSYMEVSASDGYTGILGAFTVLFKEVRTMRKREKIKKLVQGKASKMSQIRETLKGLTDFRIRTSTF